MYQFVRKIFKLQKKNPREKQVRFLNRFKQTFDTVGVNSLLGNHKDYLIVICHIPSSPCPSLFLRSNSILDTFYSDNLSEGHF